MTRRKNRLQPEAPDTGPSIADFYAAMLGGSAPPIAVPTYQQYLDWKAAAAIVPRTVDAQYATIRT